MHGADFARHSEDRLRLVVETVNDHAIFLLDPVGLVTTWNTGAERIKGYKAEEVIGKHFSMFYPTELRESGHPERCPSWRDANFWAP